jgi:hypothetical protein
MDLRAKVILSANRALLGAVTPNLRAVTVDYNKQDLVVRAYFDTGATEDEREQIDFALTEMMADLHDDIQKCKYEPVDLAFPHKMECLREWVFMRFENYA